MNSDETCLGAAAWEGAGPDELARRWGAAEVQLFERVGSTNDVARRLAAAGHPPATVVLAEEQVAGRGRAGRSWVSPPGLGLWFSVIAPPIGRGESALLPLRVGLAVAVALDHFVPDPGVGIKWPNDLYGSDRKLGGILCEASWEGDRSGAAVAGVGLNLLHESTSFPVEIRDAATSVRILAGGLRSRQIVADRVVPAVLAAALHSGPLDLAALAAKDILRNHRVLVTDPMTGREIAAGVANGISDDGRLLVRDAAARQHHISSGTVRRLP